MALTKITTGIIADGAITSDHLASGAVTHSSLSGITTDNITEGSSNLYYTDARVGTYISGNRDYGNITTTGYIAGPATFTIDPAAVGDNTGTVVIAGNLQVDGTTTTINSTTMEVDDLNITLASGAANAAAANGAGLTIDGASATITYDGTNDEWDFNKDIKILGPSNADGPRFYMMEDSNNGAFIKYDGSTNKGELGGLTSSGENTVMTWSRDSSQVVFNENSIDMDFRVESNGNENMLFIDGGNNRVGIGTDSPNSPLEIVKNITFSSADTFPQLLIKTTATTTGNQLGLGVDETDNVAFIEAIDRGNNVIPLVLQRNVGRVGIGNSSPTRNLTVGDIGASSAINIKSSATNGYSILALGDADDDNYAQLALNTATNLLQLQNGGGGAIGERGITLDSSERVGIGETSPQTELHVKGTNNSAGDLYTAVGPGNIPSITIQNAGTTDNNNAALFFRDDGDMRGSVAMRFTGHSTHNSELRFSTTDTNNTRERVLISNQGQIGINKLSGLATGGFGTPMLVLKQLANSQWGGINVEANGNDAIFAFGTTDTNHVITGSYRSSGGYKPIMIGAAGSMRMRFDTNGRISMGDNTYTNFTSPDYPVHICGDSYSLMVESGTGYSHFGSSNTSYFHIVGNRTYYFGQRCEASGGFHTYSDERLKENITPITNALDKVSQMNGITFSWIDAENRGGGDTGKQFGVTAQNMLEVDNELPTLNKDPLASQDEIDNEESTDYYSMDYNRITPFLIEAIKELKTELDAAKSRIETLENP